MNKKTFFTLICDYFATGEGRRVYCMITDAVDEATAEFMFRREFGDFYEPEVYHGVRLDIKHVQYMFGNKVLDFMLDCEKKSKSAIIVASMDYNWS